MNSREAAADILLLPHYSEECYTVCPRSDPIQIPEILLKTSVHFLYFLPVDRTGAVDQRSSRPDIGRSIFQNLPLQSCQFFGALFGCFIF